MGGFEPSLRNAPPPDLHGESLADWSRRQNHPHEDAARTRTRSMVLDGHSAEAEPTPERISVVQVVVLDILRVAGPLTHDQLVTLYDARADAYPGVPKATPSSIRTRTSELARKGLVVATTRVAYSQYGRRATVWDITYRKEGAA